ncbi:MAG TPA: 4Fe-4S ferredoxin [Lichenihabitans sp.]|jgi:molybdopterin-containing oxidoreductase family iron-sulfur binding subunit|nr:4Fe-4S ferredoxin [Lichenihabitans sp.]
MSAPDAGLSRRGALKLLSANIALVAAGCGKPPEEIVPYVRMPERLIPGIPLEFASSLALGGYGRGVLCTSVEGRPIKVSGNPSHPMSLGATDVFAEAAVFSLYDPDRSQAVRKGGEIVGWTALQAAVMPHFATWAASKGAGLRVLTGPLTSPTALRQIGELRQRYPAMRWHMSEALGDAAGRAGAMLAFGRPVTPLPRWAEVDVLACFDADPLGPGPAQLRNARGIADRRRVRAGTASMLRVYAGESVPTLSGANADHRFTWPLGGVENALIGLARALGADLADPNLAPEVAHAVAAVAADLQAHPGRALVLAGPHLRPELHGLAHWINGRLGAPLDLFAPSVPADASSLDDLARDLAAGAVDTLLVVGCNPAYEAPAPLRLGDGIAKAKLSIHLGQMFDETAAACQWHVPESHPLESWSDLRGLDGTASIVQPLIRRLYGTRTLHAMLAALGGAFDADDYALVRETWKAQATDFEPWWRAALEAGTVPGSTAATLDLAPPAPPKVSPAAEPRGLTLCLAPDPSLWDGSFANNAWLQECPKPLTKEVWGNALGLGAQDAATLGVVDGDLVALSVEGRTIEAPARIASGHAPGMLSLTYGYGRSRAGTIGSGVGAKAFGLVGREGQSVLVVAAAKAGGRAPIHSTQEQFRLEGEDRDLYPVLALGDMTAKPLDSHDGPVPTMLPPHDYTKAAARWAMVIDTGACIGCNACVLACQVENNSPIVGPEEIDRHRDMHWLRIDRYDHDAGGGFQPVPCMQCETAPCEPVCPVAASVHDSEGLNVQVYNRCIGTRFCEANCPYKVRRFNFFGYATDQAYGDLDQPVMQARYNPNVTVRGRGVMEKCTYCVQRISGARRAAEKENRPLGDNDVVTACQSACPAQAISFGNLEAPGSTVAALRREPHHYALLDHLDTKPRTTYLARIRNPNPDLEKGSG